MPTIELREPGPIGANTSIVNIGTVLAAAPNHVRAGPWLALHWWAIGVNDRLDVGELEAKTSAGLTLSTDELEKLNRRLLQLIDGVIASYGTRQPASSDADLRTTSTLVIHAVDSSHWRIYAADASALEGFRTLGAQVTDVEDRPIPAHPPID